MLENLFNVDINAILTLIAQVMGAMNVPTALGQNFLDFSEVMLTVLFFPLILIGNLLG